MHTKVGQQSQATNQGRKAEATNLCQIYFSPPCRPHRCPALPPSCPSLNALTTCDQLPLPKNATGLQLTLRREKSSKKSFQDPLSPLLSPLLSSLRRQRSCFLSHFLDGCLLCDSTTRHHQFGATSVSE